MITQIADHFGYVGVLLEGPHVTGKSKIDMDALIQQGMISLSRDFYAVIIHSRFIIALPDPHRVSIFDCANWLYVSVGPEEEGGHNADHVFVGEVMNGDDQVQELFVPPHQDST
ncbi:hypothetical protein RYX36_034902 [Vicia faba]